MRRTSITLIAAIVTCSSFADEVGPGIEDSCLEVEVDGVKAPSYTCLTRKLQPSVPSHDSPGPRQLSSETIVNKPSNQLGLFNRASTGHRMGNTFGVSVYPQRPESPNFASPFIPNQK